jgi:microcompartment protein CcmK/EutM
MATTIEGSTVTTGKMDWELLRKQKLVLVELRTGSVVTAEQEESLEGILNLIDFIQDQVVDSGQESEAVVFGNMKGNKS